MEISIFHKICPTQLEPPQITSVIALRQKLYFHVLLGKKMITLLMLVYFTSCFSFSSLVPASPVCRREREGHLAMFRATWPDLRGRNCAQMTGHGMAARMYGLPVLLLPIFCLLWGCISPPLKLFEFGLSAFHVPRCYNQERSQMNIRGWLKVHEGDKNGEAGKRMKR